MKVEAKRVPISRVFPNEWNFNRMTPTELQMLKESLSEFGYVKPIICIEDNNKYIIVDGEHRWKALKSLKAKEIDILVAKDLDKTDAVEITTILNIIRPQVADMAWIDDLENQEQEKKKTKALIRLTINRKSVKLKMKSAEEAQEFFERMTENLNSLKLELEGEA